MSAPTVFLGAAASGIDDRSSGLTIVVAKSAGSLELTDLARDPRWVMDLTGGVGGFTTPASLVAALQSDGHGGALLMLGSNAGAASIDFVGITPGHIVAADFRIG